MTAGDVASVGVGGLLLGGGIGWMVHAYGLTIDRLRSVELVTADGQLLRASANENPELFWGLRGGGGNFGVATAFEVDLHPGGTILGGAVFYEATEAERILREYTRLAATAPDELSTEALFALAPSAPFIPPDKQGTPVVGILVCYTGDISEGEILTGLRFEEDLIRQLFREDIMREKVCTVRFLTFFQAILIVDFYYLQLSPNTSSHCQLAKLIRP
jgi:FAD/FMN-containing dehydrogenase